MSCGCGWVVGGVVLDGIGEFFLVGFEFFVEVGYYGEVLYFVWGDVEGFGEGCFEEGVGEGLGGFDF